MRFRLRSDRLLWLASWLSVRARRRQRSGAYGLRPSCRAPQAARGWRNRHVHLACTTADASKSAGGGRTVPFRLGLEPHRSRAAASFMALPGVVAMASTRNVLRGCDVRGETRHTPSPAPRASLPVGQSRGQASMPGQNLQDNANHGAGNARKPRRARVMSNRLAQGHGHARWRHGYGEWLDLYLEFIDSGRSRSWFPCRAAPNPQSTAAIFAGMGAGHGRLPASRKGRQSEAACQAQGYVDLAVPSAAPAGCRRNANRKFPPPTGQDTSGFYAALSNAG